MRKLLLLLAVTGIASAQSVTPEEVDARIQAVVAQRNQALDEVAVLKARAFMLESELKKQKACEKKE